MFDDQNVTDQKFKINKMISRNTDEDTADHRFDLDVIVNNRK